MVQPPSILSILLVVFCCCPIQAFRRTIPFTNRQLTTSLLSDPSPINEDASMVRIPDDAADPTVNERKVRWEAATSATVRVKEIKRSVEDYMALPASQYSVLTANQIERLSDTEFKCTIGTLNFFGTKITPVLYVTVNVMPEAAKSEIIVTRAETIGSEIAEIVNGTFSISAVNIVSAGKDDQGRKTLSSDTKLKIDAVVPKSKMTVPIGIVRSGGNFIMQSTLGLIVPTFIRILARDFRKWSSGDDTRSDVEGASLNV